MGLAGQTNNAIGPPLGYKGRKGTKLHIAVDTLGNLLALHVTAASDQDRARVGVLAAEAQMAADKTIELAYFE